MKAKRSAAIAVVVVASTLAAWGLTVAPITGELLGQLERSTLDWRIRHAGSLDVVQDQAVRDRSGATRLRAEENRRARSSAVRLVLFDSTSVRDWPYLTPFPRAVLADLVELVSGLGARAIGLDVYLDRRYPELSRLDRGDARLRRAIAEAGNVILVAPTEDRDGTRVLRPPHPYFAEAAAGVAAADLPTAYETVRRSYLTVRTGERGLIPSFPLALYASARGIEPDSLLADAERSGSLDLTGLPPEYARVPEQSAVQPFPIRFLGPPSIPGRSDGAFQAFSSADLRTLGPMAPAEWFRDKVVILGSGFHMADRYRTPFYAARRPGGDIFGWTYGAEIHANALENMLLGEYMRPLVRGRAVLLLLGLSTIVALFTFGRGVVWGGAAATTLTALIGALAWVVFDRSLLHVPIVAPALAAAITYVGATSYTSIVEGRERRRIQGMFGKYLAPTVVDQLVADPARLRLGGEKRRITVLFSDLAGFTSLSETLDPGDLVSLLNRYLDEMGDIIMDEGGTVDKYIGDAIMALYGAPVGQDDHALRACRTAARMQRRLAALNGEWHDLAPDALHMRIGINTGAPVVGNIGGEKRFDYTALGDAVNLAARLEPACKTYDVRTMISGSTYAAADATIRARELDLLAVYGRQEPVRVFEMLGMAGDPEAARPGLEHYDKGLAAYRNRDFELASKYFGAALDAAPDDGPSRLYLERSRRFAKEAPPADWDFVVRRQFK